MTPETVLEAAGLTVAIGAVHVVDEVSFALARGEILALVGESGCGKSMTALAVMRLLPRAAELKRGRVSLKGRDLTRLSEREMQALRGNEISMIFQEPASALDPLMSLGDQVIETVRAHRRLSPAEARRAALEMLDMVGLPEPELRLKQYPFELSGGMCQRVMIATALICRPAVLLADEPTTALDVTIQAQILELIRRMCAETGSAVVLITHDLGVVADMADRVAVMYAGRVAEQGAALEIFRRPRHPYTRLLLKSIPRMDGRPKEDLHIIPGVVPDARRWPTGCRFHTRCPLADGRCRERVPPLENLDAPGRRVACWNHEKTLELE